VSADEPVVINGWTIYAHPLFLEQFEDLLAQVEALRRRDPENYRGKNPTKLLAAVTKLAFEVIPQNPADPKYRLGDTLGDQYTHWFRDKFFQQYRLFFRFHREKKIIVYAWVNDQSTKRAYGSKTDAYKVFKKMLGGGNPPDDWDALVKEAKAESRRLKKSLERKSD
jgi:toxin YhaV